MSLTAVARTFGSLAKKRLFPTPEEAAWRQIRQRAERVQRRVAGEIRVMDMAIEYADALTLAPQWHDIFVRRSLDFAAATDAPFILDCGGNVGLASLWLKRKYPKARIVAFEADPALGDILRRNLQKNGASDVEVVCAAVWNADGNVTFRAEGTDSGAVASVAAETPGTRCDVRAVRLRPWLAAGRVDLLKLDIEGAELVVLEDIRDQLDRVQAIQMEVHDFDRSRRLLPRCLALLEDAGFEYALDEFASASWRSEGTVTGPFRRAVPAWIVLVRAWRR